MSKKKQFEGRGLDAFKIYAASRGDKGLIGEVVSEGFEKETFGIEVRVRTSEVGDRDITDCSSQRG